ncbi:DUF2807 domain-containing protein [Ornithobacterium rhinotracheale]|uniref:head GIN domain-containing protein n=1 Tax=Ornithobacterium rhinotracheale TaxID=28251 RepID=UPI00129CD3D0|nr:head GIN domain-containing protein [Ornithobacterium rhinotracheale]MRI62864.1 DUF2807 domain-containing protein [Ornithobacterium rhinotracheale]
MKKGIWLILVASLLMISCGVESFITIKGNGQIVQENYKFTDFEKLNISGSMDVIYHKSNSYSVKVTTDENIQPYVLIAERNKTLDIKLKSGSYSYKKLLVEVYAPDLSVVELKGSGDFKANDKITTNEFWGSISGSGNFKGNLNCEKIKMSISGFGDIQIEGETHDLIVDISGSGNFDGKKLQSKIADIKVSSSGDASVFVTESLNAAINGSGDIRYLGDPHFSTKILGSGSVHKL